MSAPCPTFAFVVQISPRAAADSTNLAESLGKTLAINGLSASGANQRAVVITRDGAQATDADRQVVLEWAQNWTHAASITVSDLVDLHSQS